MVFFLFRYVDWFQSYVEINRLSYFWITQYMFIVHATIFSCFVFHCLFNVDL